MNVIWEHQSEYMKSVLKLLDLRYTYGTTREKYQASSKISGPGIQEYGLAWRYGFQKSSAQAITKSLYVEMCVCGGGGKVPLKDRVA